jgi:ribosomal protein L15
MKPFFEGGQTSIVQRLPKARGFTRYYKLVKDVVIVNLGALDADPRITDAMEVTKQVLKDLGYIKSVKAFVKLL